MTDTTNLIELMLVFLNSTTTAAAIKNDYRMPKIVQGVFMRKTELPKFELSMHQTFHELINAISLTVLDIVYQPFCNKAN